MILIDLKQKTMKQNKKVIIEHGTVTDPDFQIPETPVSISELEQLYQAYKYSVPGKTKCYKKCPFYALDIDQLPDTSLIQGIPRILARERLEQAILFGVLNRSLTWNTFCPDHPEYWFWVSPNDKDFVILKEWIEL